MDLKTVGFELWTQTQRSTAELSRPCQWKMDLSLPSYLEWLLPYTTFYCYLYWISGTIKLCPIYITSKRSIFRVDCSYHYLWKMDESCSCNATNRLLNPVCCCFHDCTACSLKNKQWHHCREWQDFKIKYIFHCYCELSLTTLCSQKNL